ncbi:MAG: hypothetical protein EBU66_11965 [Bacteroidetes bacterium]|nr:hypothetical protein [Bacteroidota bacterium]
MSLFVAIFDLIFQYKIRITILIILISIMFVLHTWPNVIEGFSENTDILYLKNAFFACPVIKRNIDVNESLIEGFTQNGAVESLQNTTDIISIFKDKYKELSCDTIVFKDIQINKDIPTS